MTIILFFTSLINGFSQNFITNGGFENAPFFNCALNVTPNQDNINASPNVLGWTALPDCAPSTAQNTPNVKKNGCNVGTTSWGNNFLFLGLRRSNSVFSLDERVRARFTDNLPVGRYRLSLQVNFNANHADLGTPSTLLMNLAAGNNCSGSIREIGRFDVSQIVSAQWQQINRCFEIQAGDAGLFSALEFRLVDLNGNNVGSHVCIDEVALEKIPEDGAANDFNTSFSVVNLWWGSSTKFMWATFTPTQTSSMVDYTWTNEYSNNFGNTWNTQFSWQGNGSSSVFGATNTHYRVTRSGSVIGCPNVQVCPATSIIYANYEQNAITYPNATFAPDWQDFNFTYNRNGTQRSFTSSPTQSPGLTDQWRKGIILWWPNDFAITNPEWEENNGASSYSGNGLGSFYSTVSHRLTKGSGDDPTTYADRITFLESYQYGCSWFPIFLKKADEPNSVASLPKSYTTNVEKKSPVIKDLVLNPNPSNGNFRIAYESSIESTIEVLDATGKQVFKQPVKRDGKIEENLNLENWVNGMYLLRVNNGQKFLTKKLIIQK